MRFSFIFICISWVVFSGSFSEAEVQKDKENIEQLSTKLSDPSSNVWALFTEFDFMVNTGDRVDGSEFSQVTLFQPIMPFPLTQKWKLLTRPTLPIITAPTVTGINSSGYYNFDTKFGLGDMQLPLMLSPNSKSSIGWGLGPTFSFPTHTVDDFGSYTWDLGVAALLTYKPKGYVLGALTEYWWSVYEYNDSPGESYGEIIYFLWKQLGGGYEIGTSATITYDNNASSGNKWNIPIGLSYSFMTRLGDTHMKIQLGIEASVVKEDDYGKAWMLKVNLIPVVQALVQDPLF